MSEQGPLSDAASSWEKGFFKNTLVRVRSTEISVASIADQIDFSFELPPGANVQSLGLSDQYSPHDEATIIPTYSLIYSEADGEKNLQHVPQTLVFEENGTQRIQQIVDFYTHEKGQEPKLAESGFHDVPDAIALLTGIVALSQVHNKKR